VLVLEVEVWLVPVLRVELLVLRLGVLLLT